MLSIQAATLIRQIIYNEDRAKKQKALLTVACQLLRRQGNEAAESAVVKALRHDTNEDVRERAAMSLGRVGVGNEEVVRVLLEALHDADESVREGAAESLGLMEIKDTTQLRQVLIALNRCLYSSYIEESIAAQGSIRQLLDGRPIPGYHWVPLQKQQVQRLRFKRIVFWLSMIAIIVMIGLAAIWLLGILNSDGFPMRFLLVLAGIIVIVATVTQILGRTLHAPWEQS